MACARAAGVALLYAARFPHKVQRLVLAGAPIDMRAASGLSRLAAALPSTGFDELVRSGDGIVSGRQMSQFWSSAQGLDPEHALQRALGCAPEEGVRYRERFQIWDASPLDLPGSYYLEVARRIFRENQIAEGRFVALGRTVRLSDVTAPLFLLTAADDEIVPPAQTLATERLVATPAALVETASEPCTHLGAVHGQRRAAQLLASGGALARRRGTCSPRSENGSRLTLINMLRRSAPQGANNRGGSSQCAPIRS